MSTSQNTPLCPSGVCASARVPLAVPGAVISIALIAQPFIWQWGPWQDAEARDFEARWAQCTMLATNEAARVETRERGMDRLGLPEISQLVEDCMDDGSPIDQLFAKWRDD